MPSFRDFEDIQFDRKPSSRRLVVEMVSAFSRLLNVLIFREDSNLCISSSLYKKNSKAVKVIDFIYSLIEKEHCMKSYYYDLAKSRKTIINHEHSWRHGISESNNTEKGSD